MSRYVVHNLFSSFGKLKSLEPWMDFVIVVIETDFLIICHLFLFSPTKCSADWVKIFVFVPASLFLWTTGALGGRQSDKPSTSTLLFWVLYVSHRKKYFPWMINRGEAVSSLANLFRHNSDSVNVFESCHFTNVSSASNRSHNVFCLDRF